MRKFQLTLAVVSLVLLSGCAKRAAPPGGPPDETPPKVISTNPADGDTLVPTDSPITVQFNEPIKPNKNAVLLYPYVDGLRLKFGKKSLEIKHKERFVQDATYTLILTPAFSDRHGNKLGKVYEIAFSTGIEMDTLVVDGVVLDGELFTATSEAMIAVYADSLMPDSPLRVTFSAHNGHFRLKHLPQRSLWLFALAGSGSSFDWERADKVAIPTNATLLPQTKPQTLILARNDTLPPKVISTSAADSYTVRIKFDECPIIDSISADTRGTVWFDPADSMSVLIRQKKSPLGSSMLIKACDGFYNCAVLSAVVPINAKSDTNAPILAVGRRIRILPDEPVNIIASEPFSAKLSITIDDSAANFDTVRISPNVLVVRFRKLLRPSAVVKVVLDSLCDDFGNCTQDSFSVAVSGERLGDVTVSGIFQCENLNVFLRDAAGRFFELQWNGRSFTRAVPAGAYTVWRFCDENNDGRWTPGRIKPFRYSELLELFPDTISVRAGWESTVQW